MKRLARLLPMTPALLAAVVLAGVIAEGVSTVQRLRAYGPTSYPLVSPLNIIPASLIACSFLMLVKGRGRAATVLGSLALIVVCVFWISQTYGRLG
jgi:hypothetical protein